MRARYRNKKGKIIVELEYEGKWHYIKTLSDPLKEFKEKCLEKVSLLEVEKNKNNEKNASNIRIINIKRTEEKDIPNRQDSSIGNNEQGYSYAFHNPADSEKKKELTEEEKKLLWELTK